MRHLAIILSFLISSCTTNLFEDSSIKDTDEDYLAEAQDLLNQQRYQEAIDLILTKVSVAGQNKVDAREMLSSGYAGKCGMNFIDYTENLSQQTTGSSFYRLMVPFVQKAVSPSDCYTALTNMQLLGTSSQRTLNQNTFMAVVGMVYMGSALRGYADITPSLGNGVADVDICSGLTDAQIDDVILGFGFMAENFSAVGSTLIGGSSLGSLDAVISVCTAVAGSSCAITDPANITSGIRSTFRDLINTSEYGIGSFSTGGNDLLIVGACP